MHEKVQIFTQKKKLVIFYKEIKFAPILEYFLQTEIKSMSKK